jgi:hypothetical protein
LAKKIEIKFGRIFNSPRSNQTNISVSKTDFFNGDKFSPFAKARAGKQQTTINEADDKARSQ